MESAHVHRYCRDKLRFSGDARFLSGLSGRFSYIVSGLETARLSPIRLRPIILDFGYGRDERQGVVLFASCYA